MIERVAWVFIGQNELGAAALESLIEVLGNPSKVVTRPRKPTHANRVEEVADAHGIAVAWAIDHRLDGVVADLAGTAIAICRGWARRISPDILSLPEHGILNLHPGALPEWAGSDPIGWQLAVGNSSIGYSVHRMNAEIDAGEVLADGACPVLTGDTGLALRFRVGRSLGSVAGPVASALLSDPVTNKVTALTNRARTGSVGTNRVWTKRGQATPPRGVLAAVLPSLLSVADADRIIRAFSPFPGVVARIEDEWLVVRSGEPSSARGGAVLDCRDGRLSVDIVTTAVP